MKTPKKIMIEAWHITVEHRKELFWFGFVPSFFSILMTAWYVFYQGQWIWHASFLSEEKNDFLFLFLSQAWEVLSSSSSLLTVSMLCFLFIIVGWFFSPMISRAAITHLVSQARRGKPLQKGFSTAFFRFFPLFEMAALRRGIDPISFLTEYMFVVRNIPSIAPIVTPILLVLGGAGIIALFFLTYTMQVIMLREKNFIGSISLSFRTVVENFGKTFRILLMFIFVELRVLVNVIIVLFFPLILMGVVGFFTNIFSHIIGIILGGILLLFLLLASAYITGMLFVFSESILTLAFLEFTEDSTEEAEKE